MVNKRNIWVGGELEDFLSNASFLLERGASGAEITAQTGLHRDLVISSIAKLEAAGIVRARRIKRGGGAASEAARRFLSGGGPVAEPKPAAEYITPPPVAPPQVSRSRNMVTNFINLLRNNRSSTSN